MKKIDDIHTPYLIDQGSKRLHPRLKRYKNKAYITLIKAFAGYSYSFSKQNIRHEIKKEQINNKGMESFHIYIRKYLFQLIS